MKRLNESFKSLEPFFEKISRLTKVQRILICCGTWVVLILVFGYFLYLPKFNNLEKLTKQYEKMSRQLNTAKRNARQLKTYQIKMKKAERNFKIASKKLPEKKEIPSLLAMVSASGIESGLEFVSFTPKNDKKIDFYSELPVSIEINGGYHNVAVFFDKVSQLSRIVNIKDIEMESSKDENILTTKCTAVTYRFLEVEQKKTKKKRK